MKTTAELLFGLMGSPVNPGPLTPVKLGALLPHHRYHGAQGNCVNMAYQTGHVEECFGDDRGLLEELYEMCSAPWLPVVPFVPHDIWCVDPGGIPALFSYVHVTTGRTGEAPTVLFQNGAAASQEHGLRFARDTTDQVFLVEAWIGANVGAFGVTSVRASHQIDYSVAMIVGKNRRAGPTADGAHVGDRLLLRMIPNRQRLRAP